MQSRESSLERSAVTIDGRVRRRIGLSLAAAGCLAAASARGAIAQAPIRNVVTADDGHLLTVWEKRPAHPRRAIVLLHGRTWSALPDFDLQVPSHPVSLMDTLVAQGYAVFALDARGYGGTPRDASGWLTPNRAAADAIIVCRWVAKTTKLGPPALFGWSYGSVTAQLAAQQAPDAMSALVLFGHFSFPGAQQPDTGNASPARETTTAQSAGEDFISPAATDPAVKEAYVRAALAAQPIKPDWRAMNEWNALDPTAVHVPTLELMGQRDPISTKDPGGEAAFFGRLGTGDREFVVLSGVDHAAFLESARQRFVEALVDFLSRPRP